MNEELLHFSVKPLLKVRATTQERYQPAMKPEGLWVSVGLAWPEWCQSEQFGLDRFECVTRIELAPDANVLRVETSNDLRAFHAKYRGQGASFERKYIDWRPVAEQYDGIIIAPYQWEHRHGLSWYYSWDVASGCIWHPRAIASLDSVELSGLSRSPRTEGADNG